MTRPNFRSTHTVFLAVLLGLCTAPAYGESPTITQPALQVTVNSPLDDVIKADAVLTLREAISLVNGTLLVNQLSPQESLLVKPRSEMGSEIRFNLPATETEIVLEEALPPLMASGLVVDGTTQPGYVPSSTEVAKPIVSIKPCSIDIRRGLTVMADHITIRGLSLYGFTQAWGKTATALPADILIANPTADQFSAADRTSQGDQFFVGDRLSRQHQRVMADRTAPPQGTVIEQNWLGIAPQGTEPAVRSAFGVSVFNGVESQIRNNRIAYHDGSAVITAVTAQKTVIENNVLEHNGLAGMPDAIRLEGMVDGIQIRSNRIDSNGGSAIYLFKSEGSVTIKGNQLTNNGLQKPRAAVFLMGDGHQVVDNEIGSQMGPGVVVASYPRSTRSLIQDNRFHHLQGLSIDLLSREHTEVSSYLMGDGHNPSRDTHNRRLDTGNGAINTPEFLSNLFYLDGNVVNLDGKADPGSVVDVYKVTEGGEDYGPLNEKLLSVQADEQGRFSVTLEGLKTGDQVSAIATDPRYGTSEPAQNALVR